MCIDAEFQGESMSDREELKRLALAATPGPWNIARDGKTITSNQYHPVAALSDPFHRQCAHGTGQDAEYIAAANPASILSLIAEVESLRKQLEVKEKDRMCASLACQLGLDRINELEAEIAALRSSRKEDIERAVRLTMEESRNYLAPSVHVSTIIEAVISQMEKNNG